MDTVPDVRTLACKSLSKLVKEFGERQFDGLVEELLALLKDPNGSIVDRQGCVFDSQTILNSSGSAQALAEILGVLGISRLDNLMSELFAQCESGDAATREGAFVALNSIFFLRLLQPLAFLALSLPHHLPASSTQHADSYAAWHG